jgi:hypothetical protein
LLQVLNLGGLSVHDELANLAAKDQIGH